MVWPGIDVNYDGIGVLQENLERDPYFGVAIPRVIEPQNGRLYELRNNLAKDKSKTISRQIIGRLTDVGISTEFLSPCFLISKNVLENFNSLDEEFFSLEGAFLDYMCRIRRVGYRCIVSNKSCFLHLEGKFDFPNAKPADFKLLFDRYHELTQVYSQFSNQYFVSEEHVLKSVSRCCRGKERPSLLIDANGLISGYNGTVEASFALLDGFKDQNRNWDISILSKESIIDYHRLRNRYPNWNFFTGQVSDPHTVCMRINQPFCVSDLMRDHNAAFFNITTILDTISWDVGYVSRANLSEVWDLCSQFVDGIIYDSNFTRQRFNARFPVHPEVRELAQLYSMLPEDYVDQTNNSNQGDYIFFIGNSYFHKDLNESIKCIVEAFPYENIKALGLEKSHYAQVEAISSGHKSDEEIASLFANAKLVIFPSFYEGFGFPVIKGLSFGKTVIVRNSQLWEELADNYKGRGKLCQFKSYYELFNLVGNILSKKPVPSLSFGKKVAAGAKPLSWLQVSSNIFDFIESVASDVDMSRWRARDRIIRAYKYGR